MTELKAILMAVLVQMKIVLPVEDVACMTQALHFESGWHHTSISDRMAVGLVIMNRVKSHKFPNDICAVVNQPYQFSFTTDKKSDDPIEAGLRFDTVAPVYRSGQLAVALMSGGINDITHGATHFHAHYVSPRWNRKMVETYRTKAHIFYKRK